MALPYTASAPARPSKPSRRSSSTSSKLARQTFTSRSARSSPSTLLAQMAPQVRQSWMETSRCTTWDWASACSMTRTRTMMKMRVRTSSCVRSFAHSARRCSDQHTLVGIHPASSRRTRSRTGEQGGARNRWFPPPAVRHFYSRNLLSYSRFLSRRSAKAGKTTGAAADTEYRAVLDHLVADLLATLRLPEWPGAEVLLTTLCRSMVRACAISASHQAHALLRRWRLSPTRRARTRTTR